ncbi:MAG TPA: transcription termination/antitermination NusG family protein [Victivallales bacterium]|nr:transcription termination/antitermination NusG family protein [Victivallales bacterium]
MNETEIVHIDDQLWTPVRTKVKREKKLAEYCKANNIVYYLPLRLSIKRYNKKNVTFNVPMFPGYIFCNISAEIYKTLVKSHHVLFRVGMDIATESQLISELNALKILESISTEKELAIKPEIVTGQKITVTTGPLSGVEGIVKIRNGKELVTINIEILGQSVTVESDIGDVELTKD